MMFWLTEIVSIRKYEKTHIIIKLVKTEINFKQKSKYFS